MCVPCQVVVPHVVEPALGGTRLLLAVLCDAYNVESIPGAEKAAGGDDKEGGEANTRTVLKLHEDIAPFKLAVRHYIPPPRSCTVSLFKSYVCHCGLHC